MKFYGVVSAMGVTVDLIVSNLSEKIFDTSVLDDVSGIITA